MSVLTCFELVAILHAPSFQSDPMDSLHSNGLRSFSYGNMAGMALFMTIASIQSGADGSLLCSCGLSLRMRPLSKPMTIVSVATAVAQLLLCSADINRSILPQAG